MIIRAAIPLRAIVTACFFSLLGCGDDPPPPMTTTCSPTCSAGYTCVMGACVPVCTPACKASHSCRVVAGMATCVDDRDVSIPDQSVVDAPTEDVSWVDAPPDSPTVDDAAMDASTPDVATTDRVPAPDTSPTCTPPCSLGFTCVSGVCVALCNPPCSAGETCAVRDGFTVCLRNDGGLDTPPPGDASTDRPSSPEVAGMDASSPSDVSPDGPPPPCGMTGQPCCGFDPMLPDALGSCRGTNLCDRATRRCVAYTPEANECTATAECPADQVCALGELCSGATRSCLRCIPRAMAGTLPAGAPCGGSIPGSCADGICANSRCTRTCVPGPAGDATCRAFNPQTVCAELLQSVRLDGGLSNPVSFGACIRSCARDADCMDATGNLRCGLSVRRIDDRFLQTCRVPFGTLAAGASCPLTPTSGSDPAMFCQSGQCFSGTSSTTVGYCSAFCATDADCPASARFCRDIPFFRPSGPSAPTQSVRMCEAR